MSDGTPPDPNAPPAPDDTRFGALANIRGRFMHEMSDNPDLMRRLTNSAYWEVGNQGPKAWQAYLETVMNRAVSRPNQNLDKIISDVHYYPETTTSHLDDPLNQDTQQFQSKLAPVLQNVLGGSNISSYATGNQSDDVKSGGAQITIPRAKPWGDDFVREPATADKKWVDTMTRQQKQWQEQGQPVAPAVNIMGAYKGPDPGTTKVAPRAQPVVQPVVRKALPVAQADSGGASLADADTDDEDDPAYHWPDA